jgi:hypothetical protein
MPSQSIFLHGKRRRFSGNAVCFTRSRIDSLAILFVSREGRAIAPESLSLRGKARGSDLHDFSYAVASRDVVAYHFCLR